MSSWVRIPHPPPPDSKTPPDQRGRRSGGVSPFVNRSHFVPLMTVSFRWGGALPYPVGEGEEADEDQPPHLVVGDRLGKGLPARLLTPTQG